MVSIVIPCYNCESTIDRTLNSVFKQSFTNWELIFVNNNSTDNTASILDKYKNKYPDKVTVLFESKPGAPAARNTGLRAAKGDWIQFLDADDEILADKLSRQINLATTDNKFALIASPYTMTGTRSGVKFNIVRELETDAWMGLIRSMLGITSANIFRKDVLIKEGGWDENLAASQEYDLMFRIMSAGIAVGLDNNNNTIIHQTENSVSRSNSKDKLIEVVKSRIGLRDRIETYLKNTGNLTPARKNAINIFIYSVLIPHYRFVPGFISEELKSRKLSVPLKDKLKGEFFMLKMKIRNILRQK